jgi:hypothetical protein
MKNVTISLIALLLITSCSKQNASDEPADKWNGYSKYLKMGEMVHTLRAGKTINVGTVTYGIDNNANFYVTYDCSNSGWTISETHMFAGDKKNMPLNKPGSPKIGQFPNSGTHNPRLSTKTYRVPLSSLPPAEEPGFVVASHCVVRSPSGQVETAWAEGDYTFTDKSWGWYDAYYYNQSENQFTILYGTSYAQDSLQVYHLNMTTGAVTMVLQEYVGIVSGIYDGTAFDNESGMLFFVNYNTSELFVNQMNNSLPSFSAGILDGTAASGTYYNDAFYYVNADFNTINKVTFTSNWQIANETVLDAIPGNMTVNDIAMSPAGDCLYIIGEVSGSGTELIEWVIAADTYYTVALNINDGSQIAFGSDGNLYAVAPLDEGGGNSSSYIIDVETGILTELEEGQIIIIDDAFSDIANGPVM